MRNPSKRSPETTRPQSLRPKFSVSALLLAGAISLTGLFATHEASALSGTLSAAGTTTTPRDSSGASGGATLIRTAASASASEAPSSSQVTGPSESSSASAPTRTSGGSRRRAQTEEGGSRHRNSGSGTAKTSHQGGGKAVVESKDNKTVAPVPSAPDRVHFSLSGGFESRYIYHGLDIIAFNSKLYTARVTPGVGGGYSPSIVSSPTRDYEYFSKTNSSSAITYENADVAFEGAHIGVGYVRAVSATYPFFQGSDNPAVAEFYPLGALSKNDAITGNHRRFYQEVDVNLDYTASIVANILDGTLGYNSYFFPYHDFKGAGYQGEAFFRLAYKQLKYVVPSATYYHYVSSYSDNSAAGNLNGNYMEFRIDGAVPVYSNNLFAVALAPYIAAGYNIDYLKYGDNNVGGWNDLEMGLKVPTTIGKHFTVTPYGNYGMDLSSNNQPINNFSGNGYGERTHFWGGVTVAYSF